MKCRFYTLNHWITSQGSKSAWTCFEFHSIRGSSSYPHLGQSSDRPLPSYLLQRLQENTGVLGLHGKCNPFSERWVCPGASSQLDMPKKLSHPPPWRHPGVFVIVPRWPSWLLEAGMSELLAVLCDSKPGRPPAQTHLRHLCLWSSSFARPHGSRPLMRVKPTDR